MTLCAFTSTEPIYNAINNGWFNSKKREDGSIDACNAADMMTFLWVNN